MKKKLTLFGLAALVVAGVALATDLNPVTGETHQSITIGSTATNTTANTFGQFVTHVLWTVKDAPMYVTFDGTTHPTNGHYIVENSTGVWTRKMYYNLKAARGGSTDAELHVTGVAK